MSKNDNITFMCELPPPYGGVTVKNQLILDAIKDINAEIDVIDFFDCKRKKWLIPIVFIKMIWAFVKRKKIIYGFGSLGRLKIALVLQRIFGGKKSLNRTINLVMGGQFHNSIRKKSFYAKICNEIKVNYVESVQMIDALREKGIDNGEYFPNPRSEKGNRAPRKVEPGKIKCVFFSQISTMKGVREIIDMCRKFTEDERKSIFIDFYGHIVDEIRKDFEKFVEHYDNVKYCGVFDVVNGNVYDKLNEYDVLLFPTKWDTEGVPGILVEAKMAGICPIVSARSFNEEIVKNNEDGIVISINYGEMMRKNISFFLNNERKLYELKRGSFESRQKYSLEAYAEELRKEVYCL